MFAATGLQVATPVFTVGLVAVASPLVFAAYPATDSLAMIAFKAARDHVSYTLLTPRGSPLLYPPPMFFPEHSLADRACTSRSLGPYVL